MVSVIQSSNVALSLEVGLMLPGGMDGLGRVLIDAFAANGCIVRPLLRSDSAWPKDLDLIVTFGPMQSLGALILRLEGLPERQHVIAWYTEPMPPPWWPGWFTGSVADMRFLVERRLGEHGKMADLLRLAGRLRCVGEMRHLHRLGMLDLLAVFTLRHQRFFQQWDLPVVTLPMGYHSSFGRLLGLHRDIDVVFLGSRRDRRRKRLVSDLQCQLAERGIGLLIKDGSPEYGSAYGEERVFLLNRAKILLNIMRQPWDDPVFRMLLTAPNGAMMLSELVSDAGPFTVGEHFSQAEIVDLCDAICHFLGSEYERREIAEKAHDYVTHELTMEAMVNQLLLMWTNRISA